MKAVKIPKAEPRKARKVKKQTAPRVPVVGVASPSEQTFYEDMKATVELLTDGWYSAREIASKLSVSYQTPYNRLKKLESLGFVIESREDPLLSRTVKRFHIKQGDVSILDRFMPR